MNSRLPSFYSRRIKLEERHPAGIIPVGGYPASSVPLYTTVACTRKIQGLLKLSSDVHWVLGQKLQMKLAKVILVGR